MPWEGEHNSNALGQGWAFSVEVTELQMQTITLAIGALMRNTTFRATLRYCTLISSGSSRCLFWGCTTYCWITLNLLSVIPGPSTDIMPTEKLLRAQQQLEIAKMNNDACRWQTKLADKVAGASAMLQCPCEQALRGVDYCTLGNPYLQCYR